jgi:hypothetical protein
MVLFVTLLIWGFPRTAHAYLDPGTGTFVLQMIVAFFVGASVLIRIYWKKLKSFFSKLFSAKSKDDD